MSAIVAIVEDVRPHGDNLTIVTVMGNEVVANLKEDGTPRWEVGEVCVYISEGSVIPMEVLEARGYAENGKGMLGGNKGNRVKMRRFAGHESRGLLFKTNKYMNKNWVEVDGYDSIPVNVGDDVTKYFGIQD